MAKRKRKDKSWLGPAGKGGKLLTEPFDIITGQPVPKRKRPEQIVPAWWPHIILVGDIVTGFEAYGPFESGHDAIAWKQSTGPRELCQGQWYLMQLKPPIPGKD